MAAMLFMYLSRQTSFKNLVKPWRENMKLKKNQKCDLYYYFFKIMIF